ncbi:WxL domain-containing protein [Enterococcus faecalis]|uniref:WxL domain-containing protein n=1 Tax=Enterococcus faecalis TaxID=1351 RepID=UPI0025AF0D16|nr:WxL domain-containing protein [Enterococcus faecalis]MDN3188145.1 WxL domain-containing protein [Enterococcus faecalis]
MKKKTLVTLFAGTAILGASIAPAAAHATTTGTTPANVEMTSGSLPGGNGDGDDGSTQEPEPGSNTNFDLLYVPTEFKFASTEVSSDLSAISLDANGTQTKRYAVGDVRGTQAGWSVTAGVAEMKNGTATLEGSITFAQTGAVAKYDETAKTYSHSRDVAAFAADPGSPEFAGTTIPVGGAAVSIATAAVGKGQGTWDSELSNVKLNITTPSSKITNGAYTGNVTWTLVAAP